MRAEFKKALALLGSAHVRAAVGKSRCVFHDHFCSLVKTEARELVGGEMEDEKSICWGDLSDYQIAPSE